MGFKVVALSFADAIVQVTLLCPQSFYSIRGKFLKMGWFPCEGVITDVTCKHCQFNAVTDSQDIHYFLP